MKETLEHIELSIELRLYRGCLFSESRICSTDELIKNVQRSNEMRDVTARTARAGPLKDLVVPLAVSLPSGEVHRVCWIRPGYATYRAALGLTAILLCIAVKVYRRCSPMTRDGIWRVAPVARTIQL